MKIHIASQSQGYSNRRVYIAILAQGKQPSMVAGHFIKNSSSIEVISQGDITYVYAAYNMQHKIATGLLSVVRV